MFIVLYKLPSDTSAGASNVEARQSSRSVRSHPHSGDGPPDRQDLYINPWDRVDLDQNDDGCTVDEEI